MAVDLSPIGMERVIHTHFGHILYLALKLRIDKFVFAKNNVGQRKYNFLCVYFFFSIATTSFPFILTLYIVLTKLFHAFNEKNTCNRMRRQGGESGRTESRCYVLMYVLTLKRV
jgi:hypothetical protein